MDAIEKRVVVVLADISGYTKFMVENQMSAVHGQQCITFLIETLIREIDIPLRLQEIEGDALFLYAQDPGTEQEWQRVLEQIPAKLLRFFDAFYEGAVLATDATPCQCAICRNSNDLALKIIVHTGTAVFHKIGGFDKVSGPDVILAHRLLKNSVPDDEYLLLSESAYRDIGSKLDGQFVETSETYDQFGEVKAWVHFNSDLKEAHRELMYQLPRATLVLRTEGYVAKTMIDMFPALFRHLRKPVKWWSLASRVRFTLSLLLRSPMMAMMYVFGAPRRLLAIRSERMNAGVNRVGPG